MEGPLAADDPRDTRVPGGPYLTTEELRRDVSALREILQARLDGMDRATVVLSETVNRTPTAIQLAVAHLQELHNERFNSLDKEVREKFSGVSLQFVERDVRTNQAATASAQALAAALQAAKEAVFEQAQAAAKAAEKTETSTGKQIDLLLSQIKAQGETFGDRLAELKERIDRGEGQGQGQAAALGSPYESTVLKQAQDTARQASSRVSVSLAISGVLLLISIITLILYVTKK
jgi:hypothetical protein